MDRYVAVWLPVVKVLLPLYSRCLQEYQNAYKTTGFIDWPGEFIYNCIGLFVLIFFFFISVYCNSCCGETSSTQCLLALLISIV
jgi:hypothetical protein